MNHLRVRLGVARVTECGEKNAGEASSIIPRHNCLSDPSQDMSSAQGSQEPPPVQIDPNWCVLQAITQAGFGVANLLYSIHSALREFFQPLKSNDTRADFFSVYRQESEQFDQDYTKKYDEDLNTSLIFVSPLLISVWR